MDHIADIDLIELVAGQLPSPQREAVAAHVEGCAPCRERRDQAGRTWEVLGAWQVAADPKDLAQRVLDAVRRQPPGRAGQGRWWGLGQFAALAAGIALAVGIGHLAARWSTGPGPGSPEAVVDTLYLEDFQEGSPGFFAQAVLGFERPDKEPSQ
jgi:anti-sigma factor RsiW